MESAVIIKQYLWSVSLIGFALYAVIGLLRARHAKVGLDAELRTLRGVRMQAQQRIGNTGTFDELEQITPDGTRTDPMLDELRDMQRLVMDSTHQTHDSAASVQDRHGAANISAEVPRLGWLKWLAGGLVILGVAALLLREGLMFGTEWLLNGANNPAPPGLAWKVAAITATALVALVVVFIARRMTTRNKNKVDAERESMVAYQTLAAYETVFSKE